MGTSGRNLMLKLLPQAMAHTVEFFYMLYFGGKHWCVQQGRNAVH